MTSESSIEDDDLADALRQLQPADSNLEISTVFFNLGYRVAADQRITRNRTPWLQLIGAAVLGGLLISPASYQWGAANNMQFAHSRQDLVESGAAALANQGQPLQDAKSQIAAVADALDQSLGADHSRAAAGSTGEGGFMNSPASGWWIRDRDHSTFMATALTAAHASTLRQSDFNRQLADMRLGSDDRYKTYAREQATSTTNNGRTLAVGDSNAMVNGEL